MFGTWIMAESETVRALSRWLQRGALSDGPTLLLLTGVAILFVWIGLYAWEWSRRRTPRPLTGAHGLFHELCLAHRLSVAEEDLLSRAAERRRLAQPGLLFIDPRILGELSQGPKPEAAEYRRLAERLFGTST